MTELLIFTFHVSFMIIVVVLMMVWLIATVQIVRSWFR